MGKQIDIKGDVSGRDVVQVLQVTDKVTGRGRDPLTVRFAKYTVALLLVYLISPDSTVPRKHDPDDRINREQLGSYVLIRSKTAVLVTTAAATLMVIRAATVGQGPQHTAVGTILVLENPNNGAMAESSGGRKNLTTSLKDRLNSHLSEKELMAVVMDPPCLNDVGLITDQTSKLCSRVHVN